MAIFLRESDVEKLASMKMALEAVEQAFRLQGESKADNAPRRRSAVEKGFLHVMSASLPSMGLAGLKSYSSVAGTTRFHVLLYSAKDGKLLAIIEADRSGERGGIEIYVAAGLVECWSLRDRLAGANPARSTLRGASDQVHHSLRAGSAATPGILQGDDQSAGD